MESQGFNASGLGQKESFAAELSVVARSHGVADVPPVALRAFIGFTACVAVTVAHLPLGSDG